MPGMREYPDRNRQGRRLKLEPPKTVVVEDWYFTYACRKCEKEDIETPVMKSAREPNFIPGSFATPEAVAHIATQKFVMGSPLYRQEQELNRQGVPLKLQTMSTWLIWASERASEEVMGQLSLLFNEAEAYADKAAEADDGSVTVAAHKRHKKHEYTLDHLPENVPVEVLEHRLPEEERVCPECGSTLTEIGKIGRAHV